jgi:hypothetical protein
MTASRVFAVEQERDLVAEYETAPWGTRASVLAGHGVTGWQGRGNFMRT